MKKFLIFAVSTVLLAAGCAKEHLDSANYAIVIDPTIADPELFPKTATRATDTDFEHGDRIGVTIRVDGQTYICNHALTFDGATQFFTAPNVRWYADKTRTSELSAYYPYQEGGEIPAEFAVLPDQNGDNYKASDFIAGVKQQVLPDKKVDLVFKHKMSRLIVKVTNECDCDIEDIRFKGTVGTGCYDCTTGEFCVKDGAATLEIKACERRKNELYYARLIPQNGVEITAFVTTVDGEERERTIEDPKTGQAAVDLVSGCNRELELVVTPDGLRIKLSGDIDPWVDGEDIETDNVDDDSEEPQAPVSWGGVEYKTVKLKDGRTWMAENLRYVPAGKTVSSEPAEEAGIWYPQIVVEKDGSYVAEVSTDVDYIAKVGYYYDLCTAMGITELTAENSTTFEGKQGICPDGWHIPTNAEFTALITIYKSSDGKTYWADLDKDGFNTILNQMRMKNTSALTGSWATNVNAQNHQFSGGYLMSSTANTAGNNNYKVNAGAITSQNKVLMFLDTYIASSGTTNTTMMMSNASNFAGIPVRCIKNADAQ